jgi:hypothetical protein
MRVNKARLLHRRPRLDYYDDNITRTVQYDDTKLVNEMTARWRRHGKAFAEEAGMRSSYRSNPVFGQ